MLTGAPPAQRIRLWDTFAALAWADLKRADWFVAGDVRAELHARGVEVSLPDALIATAAVNRATLWTRDRHFESIAGVLDGLELRLLDG